MGNLSKVSVMSSVAYARSITRELAGSRPRKTWKFQLARDLGWTPRRVAAVHDGEARRIDADELEALRVAKARAAETALTTEIARHAATLELHAARLASVDPDLHRAEIARLRVLAHRARHLSD